MKLLVRVAWVAYSVSSLAWISHLSPMNAGGQSQWLMGEHEPPLRQRQPSLDVTAITRARERRVGIRLLLM